MKHFADHTIHLTTTVAVFQFTKLLDVCPDMLHWVAEQHAVIKNANVTIYRGGECVAHYDHHEDKITPEIWTHTPVPYGMDIIALKDNFEKRATSVLGDYDSVPCFDVHSPERKGLYTDNRYVHIGIRGAWMMYVDQAIEHFNSK